MRMLTIDRLEGQYTICEDQEMHYFAIDTSEMPAGAVPGMVICISDEGVISVDYNETENRRIRINDKKNRLIDR